MAHDQFVRKRLRFACPLIWETPIGWKVICAGVSMAQWVAGWRMEEEGMAGGSDTGRDGGRGRGQFRDLRGPTAGLKNRLFQDRIYTFGCYLKS